jgi:hypothetical protein
MTDEHADRRDQKRDKERRGMQVDNRSLIRVQQDLAQRAQRKGKEHDEPHR